jgi:hypothetical protein
MLFYFFRDMTTTVNLESLRADHKVRELTSAEEGYAIHRLPAGVYGYAYAPGHSEVPLFAKKRYHAFEMHKAVDGTEYILGYVTSQAKGDIDVVKEGAPIRLFPDSHENSTILVSIPVAQISPSKRAIPREDGNPFLFSLS